MKKALALALSLLLLLSAAACGQTGPGQSSVPSGSAGSTVLPGSGESDPGESEPEKAPNHIEPTAVQAQEPWYLPIDEVGTYNTDIITEEIVGNCTLGEITADALPHWTGLILENKIFYNFTGDPRWDYYIPNTNRCWTEDQIRFQSEQGFNCVRVVYSFSYLSSPEDMWSINMAELEQLDELLSWCMKYNMHLLLSITGAPGTAGHDWWTGENVNQYEACFTDPEVGRAFTEYWEMLSRRYLTIPSGALSFELMTEEHIPGDNMDEITQTWLDLMVPLVEQLQADNPGRILIVTVSPGFEKLAEMGCCFANHSHIGAINRTSFENAGVPLRETHWPVDYLPGAFLDWTNGELKLQAESAFSAGEFRAYVQYWDAQLPTICIDGAEQTVSSTENGSGTIIWSVQVPEGAKEITMASNGGFVNLWMVELEQEGKESVQIPSHQPMSDLEGEPLPTIVIRDDGTFWYPNGETVSEEYIFDTMLRRYLEVAEQNNVTFIATEVGSDTDSLTVEEYLAYHEMWLKLYQEHNISWMYNCDHNIFAPRDLMWLNGVNNPIPFEHFSQWEDGPYWVNEDVLNLLKAWQ